MKKLSLHRLVPLSICLAASTAQAQSHPSAPQGGLTIETDTALMGASVPGTGGIGGGIVVEPKIEVIDNLRVGMRTAIAITGGGSIDSADSDVSVGVGVNVAAMGKVEYEIPLGSIRPVVGLGAGLYYLISQDVSAGENTSVNQKAGEFFGLAPQIGLQLGRARLAATYNAVLGANVEVSQSVGGTKDVSQDYLSLELGMRF